jgi:internalin A
MAGCAHRSHVAGAILPSSTHPGATTAEAASVWPVPMRVMAWTDDGVVELGELPDRPPAQPIAVPWYVEPERELDGPAFAKLVVALRSEHVPGLSLRGQLAIPLAKLTELPELEALVLDDTHVDGHDLAELQLALARIYLQHTEVDDTSVQAFVAREPGLQVLDLEATTVSDAVLPAIVRLAELRALDLSSTGITDAGGAQLGALAKLEVLDLGNTKIAARTIAAIRPLALRQLFIEQTSVGKEIATLAGYTAGLVRFDASDLIAYRPTERDLAWLAHAPNLVEIGLSKAEVHDKLALAFAALPRLRTIRLAATPITIAAIRKIVALPALRAVDLAATPIDDAACAQLIVHPELEELRLDDTQVTDACFGEQPSPKLTELYVSRTAVSDRGARILDSLAHLTGLGLGATRITGATLERIGKLTELRTLVLQATHTDQLEQLGALHDLRRLYLTATDLDDAAFAAFANLRELRVLHVASTRISDGSLDLLRSFNLDELAIGETRITPGKLDAWPHLRTLSVLGLHVRDSDLALFAHRTALVTLDLSFTELTDPAPLVALPNLRALGVTATQLSKLGHTSVRLLAARGVDVTQ